MRALLPVGNNTPSHTPSHTPSDTPDLHDHYAAGWLDEGGVRVNFVASVDGAVSAAGLSRGLQTPGDNRVFAVLRDLADVVVAGAGTVRAENYGPTRLSDRRLAIRRRHGLPDALPVAVVTRSLDLDPGGRLFEEGHRPLVVTCASAPADRRALLEPIADLVVVGDDEVDLPAATAALRERGLRRVLCEGGPRLFADLLREGLVTELCLSISPLLSGPGASRIVGGDPLDVARLELAGLLEEEGALFARYRVTGD